MYSYLNLTLRDNMATLRDNMATLMVKTMPKLAMGVVQTSPEGQVGCPEGTWLKPGLTSGLNQV